MGFRVELFEQIRRDHDREGLSRRALAERYRVHRRTVRQALESGGAAVEEAARGTAGAGAWAVSVVDRFVA
jgi:hypothetical protein